MNRLISFLIVGLLFMAGMSAYNLFISLGTWPTPKRVEIESLAYEVPFNRHLLVVGGELLLDEGLHYYEQRRGTKVADSEIYLVPVRAPNGKVPMLVLIPELKMQQLANSKSFDSSQIRGVRVTKFDFPTIARARFEQKFGKESVDRMIILELEKEVDGVLFSLLGIFSSLGILAMIFGWRPLNVRAREVMSSSGEKEGRPYRSYIMVALGVATIAGFIAYTGFKMEPSRAAQPKTEQQEGKPILGPNRRGTGDDFRAKSKWSRYEIQDIDRYRVSRQELESIAADAERGDMHAKLLTGWLIALSLDLEERALGRSLLQAASDAGYLAATFQLGKIYIFHMSIEGSDTTRGIELLSLAANAGHVEAQLELANLYMPPGELMSDRRKSLGIPFNPQEAFRLYRAAALSGYERGLYGAGDCYSRGVGVPQDYIQAYAHYSVAAAISSEDDNRFAEAARDSVAKKLTPTQLERAQKAAKDLWEKITNR